MWYYKYNCPGCGPEGEMLITKRAVDGSLCLRCAECGFAVDDPEELHVQPRDRFPFLHANEVVPPSDVEIAARGWDDMKVHQHDDPLFCGSCICSKRIAWENRPILWMYREQPDQDGDTGWRFLSDETGEEANDPDALQINDITTVIGFDPSIRALLPTKAPCAFYRRKAREAWTRDEEWGPPE